ncbi:hypothetical protein A0H81_05739 [Grifola frondosa]|uniref:Uncharacterized protein n=1 Tax=Grifola frondosa TaxID=5627 RepID=A0A1C7MID5_GRIFR|nr:hypothetical protein A0H81_05739 [Grifola frondosa]
MLSSTLTTRRHQHCLAGFDILNAIVIVSLNQEGSEVLRDTAHGGLDEVDITTMTAANGFVSAKPAKDMSLKLRPVLDKMTAPADNPIILNLTDSFGSMLVGQFLSCVVWGINCVQLFWYFSVYVADPLSTKALVIFLWLMDTVDHILMLQGIWRPTISHWGSVVELGKLPPAQTHHVWTTAVVGVGVQMFFIYRVYALCGKRLLLPAILGLFCLYQLVVTVVYLVLVFRNGTLDYLGTPKILALQISDQGYAEMDKLTPNDLPSNTGHHQHQSVDRSRGLIDFCLLAAHPHGFLYCIMEMPLSALYLSSFLGNLNARRFVKEKTMDFNEFMSVLPEELFSQHNESGSSDVVVLGRLGTGGSSTARGTDPESGTLPRIKVETSQITKTDEDFTFTKSN